MKQLFTFMAWVPMLALFVTAKTDAQWVPTGGIEQGYIGTLAWSGSNLFAGDYTGGGIFLSNDSGAHWTAVDSGLQNTAVWKIVAKGTNLFAGTSGGVFYSTNNGNFWSPINVGFPMDILDSEVDALVMVDTNLFAGIARSGVFLSTSNGSKWKAVSSNLPQECTVGAFAVLGKSLFAGTNNGVFLTNDNGESWSSVSTGLTNFEGGPLEVSGNNLFAGTTYDGVFRSTNSGTDWSSANFGLTENVTAFAVNDSCLFAGTGSGSSVTGCVFRSTDNGGSWTNASAGLTNTYVYCFAISGTNIFAGTYGRGVWRRPLSEMLGQSSVAPAPSTSQLSLSVYPNPSTQSTTILFTSPESGPAQVTIVNLLGTEVARLFDGELEAGEHTFTWDAHGVLPGMYWCEVRMNGHIERVGIVVE